MDRRTMLKLLGGLGLAAAWPTTRAGADPAWTAIGFSQGGLPLVVHHLGAGPRRIFILGGQHGGPEANTIELVEWLKEFYTLNPGELPTRVGLDILATANPDGVALGSRQFLSGVDPNRNWATPDWGTDAYDSNGRLRAGLGGPAPFSEQETRAVRDYVLVQRPELIVNYHSAGGFMFGGRGGLAGAVSEAYANASGYYLPGVTGGSSSGSGSGLLGYRATGSMGVWQREVGLNGLFIELTTAWDPEIERNLAGLRSTLRLLATG
jgi:hypothetical protein